MTMAKVTIDIIICDFDVNIRDLFDCQEGRDSSFISYETDSEIQITALPQDKSFLKGYVNLYQSNFEDYFLHDGMFDQTVIDKLNILSGKAKVFTLIASGDFGYAFLKIIANHIIKKYEKKKVFVLNYQDGTISTLYDFGSVIK